ncbi:hypothetical protein SAMN05660464_3530 [Geodermatophilus dictyosporus]|uniref:Uncharacterized protein n=1 Tax=Geodermatophilus dictyosporus TaxID=1523247 RepID=A0A1I5RGY8_9ACTN|nr:hypothetical protein [Geodermatophilus dictyosporus]SFP57541.1 hypothetical protein SAMN05660464_3530 [Geodermatophilus dictyosporus]
MTEDDVTPARPAAPAPEGDLPARLLAFLLSGQPPAPGTPDAEPPAVPDRPLRAGG